MQTQALEFTLLDNHLKNDGRYMAKVINQRTIGFENLLKEMENNTALRKEDIRLAITHFMASVQDNLIRGLKVETPLGVFRTSVRGSFGSLTEDFRPFADTNNHELKVIFKPSRELETLVVSNIVTERVLENNMKYPKIFRFENLSSPEAGTFKSLDVLSMSGINLKIDTAADDEGVFWTNSRGDVTKTSVITRNTGTSLQFQVPALEPETYSLSVATRLGNHILRSTVLEQQVTVS